MACIVGLLVVIVSNGLLFSSLATVGAVASVVAYLLACGLALRGLRRSYPFPSIGFANAVTLVRLVCVCVLLTALVDGSDKQWMLLAIAVVAFSSDGIDGWLARRQGYASSFGARFDVEVDSAFALVLALLAYFVAGAPWFVILLGLPRYLFAAALVVFPWLAADLPDRFSRKAVCVFQIATLIALLVPGFDGAIASISIGLAILALAWSFAIDIAWLHRLRP